MTQFAKPLEERFREAFASISKRLRRVEQATQMLEPGCLVTAYIATVSGSYTSGDPMVVMPAGNMVGPCQRVNGATVTAGATVLVTPAGQSYYVLGTLS